MMNPPSIGCEREDGRQTGGKGCAVVPYQARMVPPVMPPLKSSAHPVCTSG